MSVDLVHPAVEKGDAGARRRRRRQGSREFGEFGPLFDDPADQALEIVAIAKITIRPGSCVSLLAQP